jgi:hypothetical protein
MNRQERPPIADPVGPRVTRVGEPRSAGGAERADDNVVDLLKQLVGQGSHLAEQQLALIKAEIGESTSELKAAAGAMAGAAGVGLAGLGVILMGIAYLIGDAINNTPLATIGVGVVTLVLAYVLYRAAANKMSTAHLAPDRTQRTLQRTPDAVRGDLQTEHRR